jgi:hypothetical protein
MTPESDFFVRARQECSKQASLLDYIDTQVALFGRISQNDWREHIAKIHDLGGKIDHYPCDCDYAAAALDRKASEVSNPELRHFLLTEAFFRARWCVQASSAGGEAISRARHYNDIEKQLKAEPAG